MEQTKELTLDGKTAEVSMDVYYFYEMLKHHGDEPKNFDDLIYGFTNFIRLWDDYKGMKASEENKTEFEKKLDTHILAHTIKPRTQYAHQQEKRKGKNMLYPIYYFDEQRVHSMAMGGNYPIKECNFYVKTRNGGYVKL